MKQAAKPSRLHKIFWKVRDHLLKQNARASKDNGMFVLLDRQGRRCALGCLVPKSRYSEGLERSAGQLNSSKNAVLSLLKIVPQSKEFDLLVDLRDLHDLTPVYNWRRELRELAVEYSIPWKAPKK